MNIRLKCTTYLFALALLGLMACAVKRVPDHSIAALSRSNESAFNFDLLYGEGLRHKFMGNGSDALRYFDQCRRIDPDNDAVYYQIAQILLNLGNFPNGKLYAKRAYELDKQNIWYSTLLAGVYFQENKIDSAIYFYEKTLELTPDYEALQMLIANMYSEKGDYENAIRIHREFQQKYGINEITTPAYIQNLIRAGKLDLAFAEVQEAIELLPDEVIFYTMLAEIYAKKGEGVKATEIYKQLLTDDPQNTEILMMVCDFLLDEERYDELFHILDPIILEDEISKEEKISLFTKLLLIPNFTNDMFEQTVLSLMILESVYENDEIVVLLRPELLDQNNRTEEAIKLLEEIISKSPDNYYAWEKLLLLYYETRNYNKLMTYGEEGAARFNRSFLAKLLYAYGALENKHYDIALEELRKAEILAGGNKETVMQVYTMKTDVLYKMNNFEEAFQAFEEALKIDPDDIVILNNYAYYLAEQNTELKKAERMARKVIEHVKDNATFLDTYAWVLFKMGKTKAAAKIMEQIISRETVLVAEYYEHYGFILQKLRRCEQAIKNWEIAVKLDSSKSQLINEIENCGKRR